jgi:acyl-coenzyme A thioesterase PaaI-like protein
VIEAESGRVVVTIEPSGAHLNPAGTVHGGLSATLLDSCMGLRPDDFKCDSNLS